MDRPMNGKELAAALGLGKTRFQHFKRLGRYRRLEVKGAAGQRRYSRVLVEQFLAGESTSQYGRRSGGGAMAAPQQSTNVDHDRPEKWVKVIQVANDRGVHPQTIYSRIRAGKLVAKVINRRGDLRVNSASVQALIEAGEL